MCTTLLRVISTALCVVLVLVMIKVEKGYRMSKPHGCTDQLYDLMMDCWKKDEQERPTFEAIEYRMEDLFISEGKSYLEADQVN